MSYSDAIHFLYNLRLFGTKLGLENTFRLAALAGNPHEQLRFLHVAGTNGKGSTCAMLESIYRAGGLRVGLFSSPHLVSFRERIQINRQLISEEDVVRLVGEQRRAQSDLPPDAAHPTFFEVVTVMALRYFAEHRCDLVIWETGLGGRLDATNIVTPLASVITNIQLDHEKWLGSTVADIASEKAGIIKPGVPVLTAADHPEAIRVIRERARAQSAPLIEVRRQDISRPPLDNLRMPLLGEHQKVNAALALATQHVVQGAIPVSESAVRRGLEHVSWPGRLQVVVPQPGRTILLDGAHNPAGAETLHDALHRYFPGQAPTLILGIMQDKDWPAMCRLLVPLARRVLVAPVLSERTASPAELERQCAQLAPGREVRTCDSLANALEDAASDPFVLITGSLHFVGEATELLGLLPAAAGERGLNEWDASARGGAVGVVR